MKYKVKAPDGRTVVISGDSAPTDADLDEIFSNLPAKQTEKMGITPEVLKQRDELLKDAGIDTSGSSVASSGVVGFGKGVLGGAERIAGGATLGLSDWVGDKLGTGVKERRKELEELNPAIKGINLGTELVGGGLTGGGLFKGVSKGLGAIPKVGKAAQYLAPTVTGAVSGGLYSGFENDSLNSGLTGAAIGGAIGGALDLAGRGLSKAWSAASKVKNTPRGFENAVGTKEGARTLNRAVRESDKIAEEVYAKAPETLETLNARAMDKLDDAVKGGVDVKGRIAGAKKAYGDFIDENKAKQIVDGKFTPDDYKKNLQKWFKGSKVVDETGNPLKVYHGGAKFDKFDNSYDGTYYFTTDKKLAEQYAKDYVDDLGRKGLGETKEVILNIKNPAPNEVMNEKLLDEVISMGYDGHIFDDVMHPGQKIIRVFNPNQIKSVQNSGAFTNTASLSDKGVKPLAKVSDLEITGLTDNQKSWLNQAWTAGKRNTLEKAGSLGHLDEMSKELNKMVQSSRLPNATGVGTVATPETVALQGLKDKVDEVIEKAGLQSIKAQYRQAKTLEDSFNRGLKFKPTEIKTRDLTFKTPEEKSAFAQGLIEQIKMNPETKNIAGKARDLRGALRKVLGDDAKGVFNEIDNINKSYKNVEKILGNAERKLSVPEPINGRIGLLRELIESPGSLVGGTADFARRWGTAKSAERAAKYLLNPNLKIGKSPYDAMRPYLPTLGSILETNVMKGEQ